MRRLTDTELEKRRNWELLAPNARQQPDEEVLAMIEEILQRRESEDASL